MMNASVSHTDSTDEMRSGFGAMYESFMAADDLHSITCQIMDLAAHLTGAENCSLMLLNGHDELYVLNAKGIDFATLKSSRIKVGEGISGQVVVEGSPLLVEDISKDTRFAVYKRSRYRTGSFIACPITSQERVLGVLNLNDKKSGKPFNPEDFDQAKLVSLMAAVALRSFLGNTSSKVKSSNLDGLYNRLVEAECNNLEFIARISHDIRTPLNNIKGAVYYLKDVSNSIKDEEFYEIIEKEVSYIISYLDDGAKDYERMQTRLADIEEREKYKTLLT